MDLNLILSEEVELTCSQPKEIQINSPQFEPQLLAVPEGVREAMQILKKGVATGGDLMQIVVDREGIKGLVKFDQVLGLLRQFGYLGFHLKIDSGLDIRLFPLSHRYERVSKKISPSSEFVLSRFANLRGEKKRWMLECPLGHGRIEFGNLESMTLAMSFVAGSSGQELFDKYPVFAREALLELINMLLSAKAIRPIDKAEDPSLATWEFHDLLFHARSRAGRHNRPYGSWITHQDESSISPPLRPDYPGKQVPLAIPDLELLKPESPPILEILENRASIRSYGDRPINITELGEFLFLAGRIKDEVRSPNGDLYRKPYPSSGSSYELELYLTIQNCSGIEPGMYHYSSLKHTLVRISEMDEKLAKMVNNAWFTGGKQSQPQILITITARYQRLSSRYRSICYASILKNTGVLFHHMYLIATYLSLAPCALGGGDSDLFAEICGIDYYEESAVGEFLLGSAGKSVE